ncbi:putative esterase [Colletotrichum aenigma]|uniref:putative esterase n=1 Tax=Colletotrichum aenigma TaxID=1215731 RepID=UPI0018728E6B|nr:putative esterase [Colletotrichum aenigma]KAF5528156.1 putative esterase [Colletotrichum aenigma]
MGEYKKGVISPPLKHVARFLVLAGVNCGAIYRKPHCESLAEQVKASVPELTSVSSALVSANSLNITSVFNSASFCRFNGTVPYAENNTVLFEVWLPETGSYNGRFLAIGNGGLAGTIDYAAMVENLNKGFATAGGDSGHRAAHNNGGDAYPGGIYLPFLHDRNQVLAWIRNSIALFTAPAKQIASLWYSHLALSFLWNQQVSLDSAFIPQETLTFIRDSILDKCDTLDGVADRVIENPLACSFDLSTLACTSSSTNASTCLTPAQITAAEQIYAGPRHSQANASLYPGFDLGSESEWINQEGRLSLSFSLPLLQNMVFDDLSYNGSTFDWATDVRALDEKVGSLIDSISTNLTAFKGHGGKSIVTQGWPDPYNAATWPIQHLEDVEKVTGDRKDWASLFMVPGGGHCGGASSYPQVPSKQSSLEALVEWVEKGAAPTELLGSEPADGSSRTRKLCPWPQTAKLLGTNAYDSGSYVCS